MFEKFHCKNHKIDGEKGNPPQWQFRYNDMIKITFNRNIKLLDTKNEYIDKTKKDAENAFLKLQCLICLDIVKTTSIRDFVNQGSLGCSCKKKIPYYERYPEFLVICETRNVKLLDSKVKYIRKTKKNREYAFLTLQCNICNEIVKTTNINSFYNGRFGCSCNKNIPYYERYPEVLDICKKRNVKLIDNKEEYIQKTTKDGCDTYLNLQCLICNESVNTTTIDAFTRGKLGCNCSRLKSEKCLGEILKDIFPEYEFIKIKPDWIKNKKGHNLELDYYCEKLKLAFEYQGEQHEEYEPFFHKGDINNFYKQQEHDRIKKEICDENGIKLICIPSKYDYTNPLEMCEYILDNL